MRLLFITRTYPPVLGGMERYSADLYRALSRRVETGLVANRRGKRFLPVFLPWAALAVLFRGRRYSHIHFGDGVLAPLAWLAKRVTRAKVSITVHALDVTYPNSLYQRVVPSALAGLDGLVCVSRYTRDECVRRGVPAERCTVIPNGIDWERLRLQAAADLPPLSGMPDDALILFSVGRLIRRKGNAWFVEEVMPRLPERYVYVIAGSGPEEPAIREAIRRRKLERRVWLAGRISEGEKTALMRRARWFVMPNIPVMGDAEGFGITLIEAAAQGLPSLASDIEGIRDAVIDGMTGYRVPSGDAEAFARRLQGERPPADLVRTTVRDQYDWDELVHRYLRFFSENSEKGTEGLDSAHL